MKTTHQVAILSSLITMIGVLGTGCGQQEETLSDPFIVGGSAVTAEESSPVRSATVALTTADLFYQKKSFCTATLIGPRTLLTAAHCVSNEEGKIDQDQTIYADFSVTVGDDPSTTVEVVGIATHKNYDATIVGRKDPTEVAAHDIAVLVLGSDAPRNYKPVKVASPDLSLSSGQKITLAGYGVTATRSVNNTGKLRTVGASIEKASTEGNILVIRGPRLEQQAISVDDEGNQITIPANGGACAGDSGGPAYLTLRDGSWIVIGATSYGAELRLQGRSSQTRYCVGMSGYTDARSYAHGIARASEAMLANNSSSNSSSETTFWRFTNAEAVQE